MKRVFAIVLVVILCMSMFVVVLPKAKGDNSTTLSVSANPLWTDTGITVQAGQSIVITALGTWNWDYNRQDGSCGPNGWLNFIDQDGFMNANKGELIAYIGADPYQGHWGDGSFFPKSTGYWAIGTSNSFTSPTTGNLWLGINDDAVTKIVNDNSGSLSATININSGTYPTSTSVSVSPNPASVSSPVTCTAVVSGFNPTGTINWTTSSSIGTFSSTQTSLNSGSSSTIYTDTSTGTINIKATYCGDSNNAPSAGSSPLIITLSLENFNGVSTTITGYSSLSTVGINVGFSLQQNFFLYSGSEDSENNPIVYFCQNVISVTDGNINEAYMNDYILNANGMTIKASKESSNSSLPSDLTFSSYIDGSNIAMTNSLGSWSCPLGLTSNAYIETIKDKNALNPNFVFVGYGKGAHVVFNAGSGTISSQTEIGNAWIPASEIAVPFGSGTGEWSQGLFWTLNWYSSSYSASSSQNSIPGGGISFVPTIRSSGTTNAGSVFIDQSTTTGVVVSISGSKAEGRSVLVTSVYYGSSTPGTASVSVSTNLNSAVYYDVLIQGISDGTATITITGTSGQNTMEYLNGAQWIPASNVAVSENSITGSIPVAALTGTPIVIGSTPSVVSSTQGHLVITTEFLNSMNAAFAILNGFFATWVTPATNTTAASLTTAGTTLVTNIVGIIDNTVKLFSEVLNALANTI